MSTRVSAPPTAGRVEIAVGGGLAFAGALILVLNLGSIPGFLAEILIGFVSVAEFWPMLGGVLLLAIGVFAIVRGRRSIRQHHRLLARMKTMRARQEQRLRQQPGANGVSAGVAGTSHRMPTSR